MIPGPLPQHSQFSAQKWMGGVENEQGCIWKADWILCSLYFCYYPYLKSPPNPRSGWYQPVTSGAIGQLSPLTPNLKSIFLHKIGSWYLEERDFCRCQLWITGRNVTSGLKSLVLLPPAISASEVSPLPPFTCPLPAHPPSVPFPHCLRPCPHFDHD